MIHITDKHNCCGCSACAQACPKHCITMKEDAEGFLYPEVNQESCVDCHLCEKVCPCLNQGEAHEPLKVVAAINPDEEVRMQSSSGGVFTLLAESIIQEGGVVFGARFDEAWNVVHDYTETIEGLAAFRGSKYVQSVIGDTYKQAKKFLTEGRKVLFSGTPCQIAGLKRFLRKEYDNLLAVEIACHGVPSPKVWRAYLAEEKRNKKIKSILSLNFRDKIHGWNGYHFSMNYIKNNGKHNKLTIPHGDNPFYRGFLNHLFIRPTCYQCPAKQLRSDADFTIADFWGIDCMDSSLDDNRGCSTVCVNTERGLTIINNLLPTVKEYPYSEIIRYNPALVQSLEEDIEKSHVFWTSNIGIIETIEKICGDPMLLKIKKVINNIIHKKTIYK